MSPPQLWSKVKETDDAVNPPLIALQCAFLCLSPDKRRLIERLTRFHSLHTLEFLYRLNLMNERSDLVGLAGLANHLHYFEPENVLQIYLIDGGLFEEVENVTDVMNILAYLFADMF